MKKHRSLAATCVAFPTVLWAATLLAQNPGDLTPRDKAEVFIQHIIKIAKVDPSRARSLVIEYEVGNLLTEAAHEAKGGDPGSHEEGDGCCASTGVTSGDFIHSALKELHADYAKALALREEGKPAEAIAIAETLAAKADPYLSAYARLLAAECDRDVASKSKDAALLAKIIDRCERLCQKERMYLIQDHRACEIIAQCFKDLGKPLFAAVQYAILLTDYRDMPPEVALRAKTELEALDGEATKPMTTVSTWMKRVEKQLQDEVTARDPTQKGQTEIVSALDKLIELQEARERQT